MPQQGIDIHTGVTALAGILRTDPLLGLVVNCTNSLTKWACLTGVVISLVYMSVCKRPAGFGCVN